MAEAGRDGALLKERLLLSVSPGIFLAFPSSFMQGMLVCLEVGSCQSRLS
jgi:hypothetical protein